MRANQDSRALSSSLGANQSFVRDKLALRESILSLGLLLADGAPAVGWGRLFGASAGFFFHENGRNLKTKIQKIRRLAIRDGRPAGREGSPPHPALWGGRGGSPPDPSLKNDQNRGEVAGQNKGLNLNFLQ